MIVKTSQIVKYCRNFFCQLKIYVTISMSCTPKVTSHVAMISDFFFIIFNKFFTNPTTIDLLIKFLLKSLFITFVAVFRLLKNCFNKFINSIFTSKNNNWLRKPIININNFVSKNYNKCNLDIFL